jgi:hypothetical protein
VKPGIVFTSLTKNSVPVKKKSTREALAADRLEGAGGDALHLGELAARARPGRRGRCPAHPRYFASKS